MFLSTSHNKIDLKCRVSIPASFRVNLEKSNETLILFKSLQFKCIEGTTSTRMQAYIDAIDELDALSDDAFLLRMMMADSFEIKFDINGRVVIPDTLMIYANLSDKAVFMGIGESFIFGLLLSMKINMIILIYQMIFMKLYIMIK